MTDDQLFGGEDSPLRESPQFRKYMEEYKMFDGLIEEMQAKRGYLSYNEVLELSKMKKIKLAARDNMEQWKQKVMAAAG